MYSQTHLGLSQYPYPHNDLLQLGAELGIVGMGLFVGLVAIALARRVPDAPRWTAVRALFLFMLVNSLVSGDIYGDRLLWGLLVVLAASAQVAQSDPANAGAPERVPLAAQLASSP